MAADFDPDDKYSWYFGPMTRDESNCLLMPERESGVFLVRESKSIPGDYVLCVKEDSKISHYIINRITAGNGTRFRIGDQEFCDIASLLNFYKTHYLDTTSLIRPAPREKVIAKFDFPGRDPEDLPFHKGDVLEVISRDEKDWWTCRNNNGQVGSIPVPYVSKEALPEMEPVPQLRRESFQREIPEFKEFDPLAQVKPEIPAQKEGPGYRAPESMREVQLPARALVTVNRIPNAYDKTQLRLEKGEVLLVTAMNSNGQWEGEINGRKGFFPFTHVKLLDRNEQQEDGT